MLIVKKTYKKSGLTENGKTYLKLKEKTLAFYQNSAKVNFERKKHGQDAIVLGRFYPRI